MSYVYDVAGVVWVCQKVVDYDIEGEKSLELVFPEDHIVQRCYGGFWEDDELILIKKMFKRKKKKTTEK